MTKCQLLLFFHYRASAVLKKQLIYEFSPFKQILSFSGVDSSIMIVENLTYRATIIIYIFQSHDYSYCKYIYLIIQQLRSISSKTHEITQVK